MAKVDVDQLAASVKKALQEPKRTIRDRLLEGAAIEAWTDAGGDDVPQRRNFLNSLIPAWEHTTVDSDPAVVAHLVATAATNALAMSKAGDGAKLTWITMRDDRVRDLHRPMDGRSVTAGTPFNVGGHSLYYPGQPVGPPEVWINCRCRLDVGAATASGDARSPDVEGTRPPDLPAAADGSPPLSAGGAMQTDTDGCPPGQHRMDDGTCMPDDEMTAAVSEEPWSNFSASDYSIEQWRRACALVMPGGDPQSKSTYKLPYKTPSGAINRNGVHAAAAALGGARGGVNAPAEAKAAARRKIRAAYSQLNEDPPDSLAADGAVAAPAVNTHDAPGWLTNPRETQRLRTYWTKGEGAGKIGWGSPGDFNRCRQHLGKYVSAPYLAGTCANLHYVALGFWPATHAKMDRAGRHASAETQPFVDPVDLTPEDLAVDLAFTAATGQPDQLPPAEWFVDPQLEGPTPLTVSADGRIAGHLATWGTCHVGFEDRCVTASPSKRNYADFLTGEVDTAAGPVPVGNITMNTGHAPLEAGPTAAVAHYDDTGTVVADVAAGEDAYGIWVAGQVRPGVTDAQIRALRAGALSGDWRRIAGHLELVAALVVNVPGFPIPRVQVASVGERDTALVAAAIVTADPAADADRVAAAVIARLDARAEATARRARAEALLDQRRALRAAALLEAIG